MPDELCVRVPDDLARQLEGEGIEELEQVRSLDWLSQSATLGVTVAGAAANLTTVLLAKDSIVRFAHRLASWAAGRARSVPGSELEIRFESRDRGDESHHRSFKATFSSTGPVSTDEMAALTSFVAEAFAGRREATG